MIRVAHAPISRAAMTSQGNTALSGLYRKADALVRLRARRPKALRDLMEQNPGSMR